MDEIDLAQQRQQEEIDHALAARRAVGKGADECDECGGEISRLRRDMGARRCIACQDHAELRAKQWNRRS